MRLPDFYVIGAQKAGTTSLHHILKQHGEIYLPEAKEAHFFDMDDRFVKGTDWWYRNFFHGVRDEKRMGVITPDYLFSPEVAQRIKSTYSSDPKFIVLLRNPIDRAYSHYLMSVSRGFETMSFEEAIENENARICKDTFSFNHFSYFSRGLYFDQLSRFLKLYKVENFRFYIFEVDLLKEKEKMLRDLCTFIDVNLDFEFDLNIKANRAVEKRESKIFKLLPKGLGRILPLREDLKTGIKEWLLNLNGKEIENPKLLDIDLRQKLTRKYKDDILKTQELIGKDLTLWLEE